RQQLSGRVREEVALRVPERDLLDPELVQPLAATAARRGGDADRGDVARPVALADGLHERRLLRADAERVRGVLHVDALEDLPVTRPDDGADEVVRIGRIRSLRHRDGAVVELPAHRSWKMERVTSAPIAPPYATSSVEWMPDSTRVCATSNAMM